MAECTEICQILNWWWIATKAAILMINAASQEELRSASDNINLIYINLSATVYNRGLMH